MRILPRTYELADSIPVKIMSLDAAPVRAILREIGVSTAPTASLLHGLSPLLLA